MRAWIETAYAGALASRSGVARRVRAWIETTASLAIGQGLKVARRVRAWIETSAHFACPNKTTGRPPCAGVD